MEVLSLGAALKKNLEFFFSNCKCQQLTYALPPFWKKIIKETDNAENFYSQFTILLKKCVLNTNISEAF